LKLPQPYGWGINQFTSTELKSAEAENRSASLGLVPGEIREGGLNFKKTKFLHLFFVVLKIFSLNV